MLLMQAASITGPQMALGYRLDAISQGLKNSRFPGPNPLPLAQVMDAAASKHYARGRINHRCIGGIMYKSPPWRGQRVHTSIPP